MPTEIEKRWESLTPDPKTPVFQLFDYRHPLPFYVGRDIKGNRSLLILCDELQPTVRGLRSVHVDTFRRNDGSIALLLTLENADLAPVFALLCEDLINFSRHLSGDSAYSRILVRRLESWRKLLERERHMILDESGIRGLFAELSFLKILVEKMGICASVRAWVGPLGADQDFQSSECVWEVKSIRPNATNVEIASERQLLSSIPRLELATVTLVEEPEGSKEGLSLNELVSEMRATQLDEPDVAELFEERLLAIGYLLRKEYDYPFLKVAAVDRFLVDDSFPKLTPQSLPEGISRTRYCLDLDVCKKHLIQKGA